MVRQLGIAPSSADYRSAALLLSYEQLSGGEQPEISLGLWSLALRPAAWNGSDNSIA